MALSRKYRAFIDQYFICNMNGTEAYMRVYNPNSRDAARANAAKLLAKTNISEEVERRLKESAMSADEVIKRLSDIASGDPADFMDISSVGYNLNLYKAKEAGLTHLIKKVKQKTTTFIAKKKSDEDREVTELELELYPADSALVNLGRMHALFTDKQQTDGELKVIVEYANGKDNTS